MSDVPPADGREATPQAPRAELRVVLVSPDRVAYDGPAQAVIAPGAQGMITILLHHAPMLTMLEPGELSLRHGDLTHYFAVGGGHLEVVDDLVTVLVDSVERPEEIDVAEAEAACEQARTMLARYRSRPAEAALALRRAQSRLRVSKRGQAGPSA
jgi:F-type H+-transporting ATPase subunit epsilon